MNIHSFALHNASDRAPRWPEAVVGSITHTGDAPGGYCGVVVGRAVELRTVGLDAEGAGGLPPMLWSSVLTATERDRLSHLPVIDRESCAKLIFSAKECFYKAQYPLSRRFLDFSEVEIALDSQSSTFEAKVTSDARRSLPLVACSGRYLVADGVLLTGIVVR
jgi:4'-phosphopantetheinyl transferase EntD